MTAWRTTAGGIFRPGAAAVTEGVCNYLKVRENKKNGSTFSVGMDVESYAC